MKERKERKYDICAASVDYDSCMAHNNPQNSFLQKRQAFVNDYTIDAGINPLISDIKAQKASIDQKATRYAKRFKDELKLAQQGYEQAEENLNNSQKAVENAEFQLGTNRFTHETHTSQGMFNITASTAILSAERTLKEAKKNEEAAQKALKAAKLLLETAKEKAAKATEIEKNTIETKSTLFIGSNRQSLQAELDNFIKPARGDDVKSVMGSAYPVFESLAKATDARLDKYILADTYSNQPDGTTFQRILDSKIDEEITSTSALSREKQEKLKEKLKGKDQPEWIHDDTKFTILYAQMHRLASQNPNKDIVYDFYDDDSDILKFLNQTFEKHPYLIPHNLTLRLKQHTGYPLGADQNGNPTYIKTTGELFGLGPIDHHYPESLKQMVRISDKMIDAAEPGYDITSQGTYKTGKELLTAISGKTLTKSGIEFITSQPWRPDIPSREGLARLIFEIKNLETKFSELMKNPNALSKEVIEDMTTKFDTLIKSVIEEAYVLDKILDKKLDTPQANYKEIEKSIDALRGGIKHMDTFIEKGIKPLSEGIARSQDSKKDKKAIENLANVVKNARDTCKAQLRELSIPEKFIKAAGNFFKNLAESVMSIIPKEKEPLSFRGYQVKSRSTASDFVRSTIEVPIKPLPKVFFLGPKMSGKTALINALENKEFTIGYEKGLGHEQKNITAPNNNAVRVFDVSENSKTYSASDLRKENADAIFFVLDAKNVLDKPQVSLQQLQEYNEWAKQNAPKDTPIQLIITKTDKLTSDETQKTMLKAQEIAQKVGIDPNSVIYSSAKNKDGISKVREALDNATSAQAEEKLSTSIQPRH